MTWTQPICDDCYSDLYPDREIRHRMVDQYRDIEHCCKCNKEIRNGLYVRIDPKTVPHPTMSE